MHDPGQLLVAALQRHRRDQLGDHVAGAVADHVGAEHLAVLGVDDELDEAVLVLVDHTGTLAGDFLLADLDLVAGLLGLGLGEADAGDLRVAEGGADHQVLVDGLGLDAGRGLDRDDALLGGLVGERLLVDQVADREDLRVRRPLALVDLDFAAALLQDQPLGVGTAATGDAEVIDLGAVVAVGELDAGVASFDVLHRRPGRDLDPLFLEDAFDDLGDVLVLGGEDLVEHLDQQHLGAEARVGGGELGARGAGADHGDPVRALGERPGAPGVDDAVAALDAGDRQRHRPGRQGHRLGLVDLVADLDVALGGQRAVAVDELDLPFLPQPFDAAGQLGGDVLAAFLQRRPVELDVIGDDAELGARLGLVEDLRRAQHRLRRDAGVVEAAAAGFVALDDGRLLAQLRGADGGDVAARAPADDDLVEGFGHAY